MGLEPGDEFRIELHKETGSIWLLPMDDAGSAEDAAASPADAPLDPDGTD